MAEGTLRPAWVKPLDGETWHILVRVQPGAKRSEVTGEMDGRLRIRVMAQAVDNKANQALIAFMAKQLGVRPNRLSIAGGETARQKTLLLTAASEPDWRALYPPDVP